MSKKLRLKKLALTAILGSLILAPEIAFADKSDDTLIIAFKREITNLDYNHGTKTEYIILGDLIDDIPEIGKQCVPTSTFT